jgi:hypothetical protein
MNDRPLDRSDPELLISRVVDGEATPDDWSSFRLQADREPSLWRDLAEAQRIQTALGEEVGAAVATSGYIDVPMHREIERRFSDRVRMVGIWGGWLAAACVGLMWAQGTANKSNTNPGGSQAKLLPDVLQNYLSRGEQEGKVLGELPEKVLVRATPLTGSGPNGIDSGYEVVYLRQILERVVVKDLYQYGEDDTGQKQPVRFHVTPATNGKPM